MAEVGLRDLGSFVPGGRGLDAAREPTMPRAASYTGAVSDRDVLVTPPPPPAPSLGLFGGQRADGPDALGLDETLRHLAELALHRGTAGPLCIGVLGGPGSGKSFALSRLASRIRDIAGAAATAQGPFLSRVHVQAIDAASLEGQDPALALAARVHAGLRQPYPEVAREIGATARDPHVVLREANEKLDDARRRLDSERRALDDASSRRARLTETVLYEAAGSQVDAYARANRPGIEARLAGFGLGGDPIRTYKDLVRLVAGSGGTFGLALRSVWAFKGQTKLILLATVLVVLGVGLGIAIDDRAIWLGDLRAGPKTGVSVADWLDAHIDLLSTLRTGAFGLAALAVVANLFRAASFLRPVVKGARLLENDLDNRRRDLDGLYAHQTKRVDALEGDVERLTREVTDAERRAAGAGGHASGEPSPFEPAGGAAQAQSVFETLSSMMATPGANVPQRIVLVLDHLDAVAPDRACALFDALHRTAGPGIVTLVGVDPDRLDPDGDGRAALERWIQVPLRLDVALSEESARAVGATLVREALGHGCRGRDLPSSKPDASRSDLDAPVEDEEADLLASLADLAGRSPRAIKRFANLYLLARLGDDRPLGVLAFMLALALGGTDAERGLVADALAAGPINGPFDLPRADGRLREAFASVVEAGGAVNRGDAAEAARRAAMFSMAPPTIV